MRAVLPLSVVAAGGYALLVRGALTLDLGIGRRVRPLGPIVRTIAAQGDPGQERSDGLEQAVARHPPCIERR